MRKINKIILVLFWGINIFAQLALFIIPASSKADNPIELLILNLSFLSLVSIFSILFFMSFSRGQNMRKPIDQGMDYRLIRKNFLLLSNLPILGFFLIFYDRIFVRGIDYSQGFRAARYEWLNSVDLGGSFISVVGNLTIPLAYISILFLIIFNEILSKTEKIRLGLAIFLGVVGHAALNGGRSNLLLAGVILLFSLLLKGNIRFFKIKKIIKIKYILIILVVAWYISLIIQGSADMGAASIKTLTDLGIDGLHGTLDRNFLEKYDNDVLYMVIYTVAYLFHGQWTTEEIFSLSHREGTYILYPIGIILNQLGILQEPLKPGHFADVGAFVSLPGAYYYDFGPIGFFCCCVAHGLLLGMCMVMLNDKNKIGILKTSFILFMFYLTILSPILPAYGMSYLNFIIWAFILLWLINAIVFRRNFYFPISGLR